MAASAIEDVGEFVPRSEYRYAICEAWAGAEPFEDGYVRIGTCVVAIDARIGMTRDHLVVARIRELESVGDIGVAVIVSISEDLAFCRDDTPEKWKERQASRGGVVAGEIAAECQCILDVAVFAIHQRRIHTLKYLLPAKTVRNYENDVARFVLGLSPDAARRKERGDRQRADQEIADWSHDTIR